MADTDRIKRNLGKMIDAGAPKEHLDSYLASEGFKSPDEWKASLAPAKPTVGRSEGVAQQVGSGALFNFGDEVAAGVRAVAPGFSNWMMQGPALQRDESIGGSPTPQTVSTKPTVGERYDEELGKERAKAKSFEESNPVLATGANIAGNIAGAVATAPLLPAGLIARSASPFVNVLKGATVGAGYGAASGYGGGEGDNRPGNALLGGGIGLVAGGAAPVIGAGARAAYDAVAPSALRATANVAEKFAPRVQPQALSAAAPDGSAGVAGDSLATSISDGARNAAARIEDEAAIKRLAIAMSGKNGPQKVQQRLTDLGDGAFIADANKGTERLAFVTQANSDDAAENMLRAYTTRNAATGTRFKADTPGAPDARTAEDFLKAYTTAEGRKIYDPVLRAGGGNLNVTPELEALKARPSIKAAFETVDEWATAEGRKLTEAERFHLVKQALNGNAEAKMQTGKAINRKMVSDTANEWEGALWAANPEIQAADQAYAKTASLPEWFDRGRNFAAQGRGENAINASPEALRVDLPKATSEQRNVLAAGARSDMHRIASQGPDQTRRLAKTLTDGDDMVGRLREILGDDVAERIISRGNTERTFAEKFGNVMRGSQTAERNASLMRDQGISPPASGDVMAVLRWTRDQFDKLNTPSEAVRRKLADLLTNPNAAENAETIALVQGILRKQAPYNAIRSGIPAAAGNATRD